MPEEKGCDSESSNVIKVPSSLSKTMKEWSEAIIRTQPSDLLRWSAVYFRMSANGEHPPVKPYLDTRDLELGPGGLSPNTLKVLAMSLSNEFETSEKIENLWSILSLDMNIYFEILDVGKFKTKDIKTIEFIGIAAAYLNKRLRDTMVLLCDTLSDEYSNGILLETFVAVYKYLARLDSAYYPTVKSSAPGEDERIGFSEKTSFHSNSECFKSMNSKEDSYVDEPLSDDYTFKMSALNFDVSKSEEGIMPYQNDNMYVMEPSFAEALNELPAVEPPMNPCDDPDLLLFSAGEMKAGAYDDELLSLLSGSSVISDHDMSLTSSGSSYSEVGPNDAEHKATDELGEGEAMSDEPFLQPEDTCVYDKGWRDGEHSWDEYETNANGYDDDVDENDYVPVNTDFIVMFALVDGPPDDDAAYGVSSGADNGSSVDNESMGHESPESVFSLLEQSGVLDGAAGAEQTGNVDKPRERTFNKNDHYTPVDRQSSDSGSDVSHEFQYSEIDQQSVESVPEVRADDADEANTSNVTTPKDDAELPRQNSLQFFMDGDEEAEQSDENAFSEYAFDQCEAEAHSYSQNMSAVAESEASAEADVTIETEELRVVQVLPGIGTSLSETQIQDVIDWLTKCAQNQNNHVYEYNLLHYLCPPLDHHHHD